MKTILISMIALLALAGCQGPQEMAGYVMPSQKFVLSSTPEVTHDANTYIIIWDSGSGDLVYSLEGADPNYAGDVISTTTWANAVISTAVHGQNGSAWVATIPPLDDRYDYALGVYNNSSPAKTDVPTQGPFLYSRGKTFSDTNPLEGRNVRTVR